ncbi:ABC transporter permease [Halomonas sp. MCCC 1A17488]|uniref:ABC transporter permease n=1 Tax=Billgrantia sulfidoxydans TaxID=2733484 RepID=A0ABX7W255_9GAMM|nr:MULTISPECIES: ABC transporter permease [Halomonas]MCE8016041.1 ABC transporter permease [Halomonas sp. MCCC 1A17488]MCG3239374.1 ABC transporter permease [Halomonas sp. MCCC 1A17488]QPP50696.1 ABC transporter permease [Halomonas sp. SS10-MC5]QTP54273.1 ABC transporter permease [Halomonas sulfidoxydans]
MSANLTATLASTKPGGNLKAQLRRAERLRKLKAIGLVAPLALFLIVVFVVPIGSMLWRSVDNTELDAVMPLTAQGLRDWDGTGLPDNATLAAFAAELRDSRQGGGLGRIGRRLNYEDTRYRGLLMTTLRGLPAPGEVDTDTDWAAILSEIDPAWGETDTWLGIQRAAPTTTDRYLLASLDLERGAEGGIQRIDSQDRVFLSVFQRTMVIAGGVTLICLALGFPLAYLLATLPARTSNLLMILVLLPFWTSLLVRTASWIILLQSNGLVNQGLINIGLIDSPLQLVFNRIGVFFAMVHILLPFMVLPLYSVMKGISPSYQRAAISLGAHPFAAFWQVYVPQTISGVAAGTILVFIMALGYYITPALVGGPADQMVSYYVAYYTNTTNNWGMAAALGSLLLVITLLLYLVYHRLVNRKQLIRS